MLEQQQEEEPQQQQEPQQQHGRTNKQGFVVSGAPWTQEAPNVMSATDFPSMGASAAHSTPSLSVWGPKRG